jgi:hypothetical protein
MDRWSYRIEPFTRRLVIHIDESAEEMNAIGAEGWESYAVIPFENGFVVFFKRREEGVEDARGPSG